MRWTPGTIPHGASGAMFAQGPASGAKVGATVLLLVPGKARVVRSAREHAREKLVRVRHAERREGGQLRLRRGRTASRVQQIHRHFVGLPLAVGFRLPVLAARKRY